MKCEICDAEREINFCTHCNKHMCLGCYLGEEHQKEWREFHGIKQVGETSKTPSKVGW